MKTSVKLSDRSVDKIKQMQIKHSIAGKPFVTRTEIINKIIEAYKV